jgi:uracil-DNA glycosylase family 4
MASGEVGDTLSDTAAPAAHNASPGQTVIGPYHLLERVGEGGMGEVWLAEQRQPVRRRVAIKLIKSGMDTREVVARFESERQALALMDHPCIAKVFDAGSTAEGRPYFVMEYVAGLPITIYCDRHKLTTQKRMELFVLVCEAVQHAHQKAIIHRDLKPSNILVSETDGKPIPRIIDFGVAKATSQQLSADTMYTQIGAVIGTLGYMSPEQADSRGADIDTRSDVYSLGVILYELLVGALPLDFSKLAYDEVLRRLREQDAPRPSTRLRSLGGDSTIAAQNRSAELPTLTRQLRGDPDAIVLKALEKDRKRRYATPLDLASDIEHYLRDEPVSAHVPSVSYRMRKYVRRHRVGVALSGVAVLLLVGFAIAQTVELRRVREERDRADRITDFMTNMFADADPSHARGNDIKVREVLDKASANIESGLDKDPQVQAKLMKVMGHVYLNLGLYAQAESLTRKAMALETRTLGANNEVTLDSAAILAEILNDQSRYPEAEKLARETMEAARRALGPEHRTTLAAASMLATALTDSGSYPEAEKLNREALQVAERKYGPTDELARRLRANLAIDLAYQAKFSESEKVFREVYQINRDTLGADHPVTLASKGNLGASLIQQDKYPAAEQIYKELVDEEKRVLGPEHPTTLLAMGNLALIYSLEHRYDDAVKLFRETFEIKQRKLGREHRSTLVTEQQLADVLRDSGKPDQAEPLMRETVAIERRTLGPNHSDTLASMHGLAEILMAEKHYADAEQWMQETVDTATKVLGRDHPDTAEYNYGLARLYALEGKKDQALARLSEAVDHRLRAKYDQELVTMDELKSLHGDPRFDAIVADAKQKAAAQAAALADLNARVVACERCPRLRAYGAAIAERRRRAYATWEYWGRPVPSFGDPLARILILGLAPGAHGSNRTGRPFTGDGSGDFLYPVLYEAGLASQPNAVSRDDGLTLNDIWITAVGRCAPPDNKPLPEELRNCAPFLDEEIETLATLRVVVALGKIAFDGFVAHLIRTGSIARRGELMFAHGAEYRLPDGRSLLATYHPSLQNTNTGRLTKPMFLQIFMRARQLAAT